MDAAGGPDHVLAATARIDRLMGTGSKPAR